MFVYIAASPEGRKKSWHGPVTSEAFAKGRVFVNASQSVRTHTHMHTHTHTCKHAHVHTQTRACLDVSQTDTQTERTSTLRFV